MIESRIFKNTWLPIVLTGLVAAVSAQAKQQYICGTSAAGVFATDVGSLNCGDGNIRVVRKEEHKAFCNYMATCTPDIPLTRMFVEIESGKRFETMTDDEINRATINAGIHTPELHLKQIQMSVQCMGVMYSNEQGASMPRCPHVNACVNTQRNTNMMWNVRAYSALEPTSDGLMMGDTERGVPARVINPNRTVNRKARP
jgi:hypothetical protein